MRFDGDRHGGVLRGWANIDLGAPVSYQHLRYSDRKQICPICEKARRGRDGAVALLLVGACFSNVDFIIFQNLKMEFSA